MDVLDLFLRIGSFVLPVIASYPFWGPPLTVLLLTLVWWELRSSRRRTDASGPVRAGVRTGLDSSPGTAPGTPLNCADMSPDMSADNRPDASGHDGAGER